VVPPDPWGPWFLQTWFCTMLLSFHVIFSFSGTVVLLQKIFEICFYINICKNSFPYCSPTRFFGAMILTNINLRYVWKFPYTLKLPWSCFYANICKHNSFPYCGPTRPPGAMILTNFNLQYVWKLQNKLQISWSYGYLEECFYIYFLYKNW
jgi:hypothetical protein